MAPMVTKLPDPLEAKLNLNSFRHCTSQNMYESRSFQDNNVFPTLGSGVPYSPELPGND